MVLTTFYARDARTGALGVEERIGRHGGTLGMPVPPPRGLARVATPWGALKKEEIHLERQGSATGVKMTKSVLTLTLKRQSFSVELTSGRKLETVITP